LCPCFDQGLGQVSRQFATVLFNGGGDSGDGFLPGFVFFQVGMPLIAIIFPLFNLFDKLLYLSPVQAYVAKGLISKNFYFLHAISSPSMSAKKSITSVVIGTGEGVQCT
jgi:hypothetical protein